MAELLLGAPVGDALIEELKPRAADLIRRGVQPKLVIVRAGRRDGDIAYERGIRKRFSSISATVETIVLDPDCSTGDVFQAIFSLACDPSVHGILPMRPFPDGIDANAARNAIPAEKDADGVSDASLALVLTGSEAGFAPCTAEACVSILSHYGVEIDGKRAVVVGRSLVVGRPLAMLLLNRNATVTVCHTHTRDLARVTGEADILIAAAGKRGLLGAEHVSPGQVVLDVGMHFDEAGELFGDVRSDEAEPIVSAITPARGGVGAVTTAILARHVIESAERSARP